MTSDGYDGYTPNLFSSEDAYRSPYAARLGEFMRAGLAANLSHARDDTETLALVLVDVQHDFVDPSGTLSVPGAQDDLARLLTWFYRHAGRLTQVYLSLDTHHSLQIFYGPWWVDPRTGEHPRPFTIITLEDVERGVWSPIFEPAWSADYVRQLRAQARKDLMIWPAHTMEGSLGHMLAPPLSEAIAWHSIARRSQPIYINKDRAARTEFYGIFGAEVTDPQEPATALNTALLNDVLRHDRIFIAGEAKSHCVLETARQLVGHVGDQPATLGRIHILRDCMSAVAHPTIDFDALADAEFARMAERGMRFVTSGDPLT